MLVIEFYHIGDEENHLLLTAYGMVDDSDMWLDIKVQMSDWADTNDYSTSNGIVETISRTITNKSVTEKFSPLGW